MLTYCVRRLIWRCENIPRTSHCCRVAFSRQHCSTATPVRSVAEDSDHTKTLMQLCTDRYYIASGQLHRDSFQRGTNCGYGPLGMELKNNILEQWWNSVIGFRAEVFGISTLHASKNRTTERDGQLRVVDTENLRQILSQRELSKDQLIQKLQTHIQNGASLRTSLFQGALEQYVPSLELVNRKLPFGLAETGLCFQPSGGPSCPDEVTQSSLVWFCSPRTSSQWLDYWARHRLQWWRKFALGPSDFSCSDITEEELAGRASRGVKIVYNFPWGQEALETLLSRGDAELLQTHKSARNKLQCLDGRKSVVPYAISVTGNLERGVLAYLYNSLQQVKKVDSKQRLQQRKAKLLRLLEEIMSEKENKTIIFTETKRRCDELTRRMRRDGWPAMGIHGDKSQQERDWVLNEFKYGKAPILIATDVASRGLGAVFVAGPRHDKSQASRGKEDILEMKLPHWLPPSGPREDYIHRIGRTARSQKTGTAYTFFTPNNMKQASDLIAVLREANQAINPKLLQMAEARGGRGGGGRGGFRDDRRDRYSGGRSYGGGGGGGGGSYRDKDSDRGFGGGPKSAFGTKTQNGVGYGGSTYDKGASSGGSYGNSYGSNGQASFGATNQVGAFGGQNFQAPPQFGAAQAAAPNGMGRPPFPFNPQAQQSQQPPPMVPYSMPPPFPQ